MIVAIGCLELLRVFWRFRELRALDVVQPTMVATVVPNLDQCCLTEGLGVRLGNVAQWFAASRTIGLIRYITLAAR